MAQAKATAEGIIAKAKADAARIQDEARAKDPELYLFLKKIDAMKELLRSNKTIILVPLPGKTLPKEAEFLWDFLKPFKQTAPAKKTDMTKKDTNRSETIRELWRQELGGVIRQMIEENRLQILEADTVSSPLLIPMQVLPKKN
ncbi:MAG TPA: hypothetical protein VFE62_00510 [Gemmataceae bacterium]|nr:hypothetical protein [Gemmataceae bacterium]